MAPKAYLFDLDGTLIDSIDLILESFHHTRRIHFGDRLPDDHWMQGIGTPLRVQLAKMAKNARQLDALVETYKAHNLAHHDHMVKPYPGVTETVRALADRGARLALVTSKSRIGTERSLRFLHLADTLTVRVCAEDVVHGKPDPEPVHRALDLLGVSSSEALFVGDSPHDMEAGRRAGVPTAVATWGPYARSLLAPHQPSMWLRDLPELLRRAYD